jgi:hypothetical protein
MIPRLGNEMEESMMILSIGNLSILQCMGVMYRFKCGMKIFNLDEKDFKIPKNVLNILNTFMQRI